MGFLVAAGFCDTEGLNSAGSLDAAELPAKDPSAAWAIAAGAEVPENRARFLFGVGPSSIADVVSTVFTGDGAGGWPNMLNRFAFEVDDGSGVWSNDDGVLEAAGFFVKRSVESSLVDSVADVALLRLNNSLEGKVKEGPGEKSPPLEVSGCPKLNPGFGVSCCVDFENRSGDLDDVSLGFDAGAKDVPSPNLKGDLVGLALSPEAASVGFAANRLANGFFGGTDSSPCSAFSSPSGVN